MATSLRLLTAKEIMSLPDRDLAERMLADLAEGTPASTVALTELSWRVIRANEEVSG